MIAPRVAASRAGDGLPIPHLSELACSLAAIKQHGLRPSFTRAVWQLRLPFASIERHELEPLFLAASIKIHRTLRMSPAMAAGVTDRLWDVNDLVALWESYEQRRAERAA